MCELSSRKLGVPNGRNGWKADTAVGGISRLKRQSVVARGSERRHLRLMHYVTVFDAAANPYRNMWFVLPGLVGLVCGAIMVSKPAWMDAIMRRPMARGPLFGWFFFLFALLWTVVATASIVSDASNARGALNDRDCQLVEGRVEHFHPMPWTGHDTERFDVNGTSFSYSDYIVTAGFNHTASHGGPIREGLPVRICYRDGEILRLEVAR